MKKIFFLLLLSILFFSCSQNLPELNSVTGSVVFDFEDQEAEPEMRLGVYVDVSSDAHRADLIKIYCLQNDFEWECNKPEKIASGKKQYAGYSNFVMPGKDIFPQGKYTVYYYDANGNEESAVMNISYSAEILQKNASSTEEFLKSQNANENLAVYDKESVLIFFGKKSDEHKELENIWRMYPAADFIRIVWTRNNGKEICIFPAVYKDGKKVTEENGTDIEQPAEIEQSRDNDKSDSE